MATNNKNAQVAKMETIVADLKLILKHKMQVFDKRRGTLIRTGKYGFTFKEQGTNSKRQPWMWWVTIARSLYGKVTTNARHAQVQFYVPHTEYQDSRELADIILTEAQQMAEAVCDVDMKKIVDSIQSLQPLEDVDLKEEDE